MQRLVYLLLLYACIVLDIVHCFFMYTRVYVTNVFFHNYMHNVSMFVQFTGVFAERKYKQTQLKTPCMAHFLRADSV